MDIDGLGAYGIVFKVLVRGRGLYTAIVSSILMTLLVILTYERVSTYLLYLMVLPTALTSLVIDEDRITQFFNSGLIVGASPKFFNNAIIIASLIYALIYSAPYVVYYTLSHDATLILFVLMTVLLCDVAVLKTYLNAVKRGVIRLVM